MLQEGDNKNKRRKTLIKFIILLLIGFFAGFTASFLILHSDNEVLEFGKWIEDRVLCASVYLLPIYGVLSIIITLWYQKKGKRLFKEEDDDLETFEKADCYIENAISVCSVSSIVYYIFFAMTCQYFKYNDMKVVMIIYVLLFLVLSLVSTFLQRSLVDFTKKMYPKMRGDVLDKKFAKEWFDSCDEFEKMIIYKSSYQTYQVTNRTLVIAFIVVFVLNIWFDIGIVPIFVIGFLWLTHSVTYIISTKKFSKANKIVSS